MKYYGYFYIFTYLNVSYKNSKLYRSRSISFTPTRLHFVHLSFPHRRKDTVARYKSINIAVYDSIPFSTRLIVFWIVAIFLFISPAQIHIYIDIRIDLDFAANVHRTIRRKGGVKLLQRHTTARAENSSVQHACVSRQVRATAKNVQLF